MTKKEFLAQLQERLEWDELLSLDSEIKNMDEWDSLSAMILIGYVQEEFETTLSADDMAALTTVESLIDKIGVQKFDS